MKKRLKINGVILFFVIILIAAFPRIFLRYEGIKPFDEATKVFGIAFILLGQIFRLSARGYKSEYFASSRRLVKTGPYALVRNPMYLGILLIGAGIVFILFQWWVAGIFLLVFIVRYISLIFEEEKKLLAVFPEDYPAYKEQVPRIFPSVAMFFEKDISEYLPLKISWIKKEIGAMLAVLLITLLIEGWQDIAREGLGMYFGGAMMFAAIIVLFIYVFIYLCKRTTDREKDVSGKSKA